MAPAASRDAGSWPDSGPSFHHVALTVRDVEASAAWYQQVLGFEEFHRDAKGESRVCLLRLPRGEILGLVEHGEDEGPLRPDVTGLDHVAFNAAGRAELDQWADRFDEHRLEHSGVVDHDAGAILNFKDPDRIALALFWDRRPR